MKRRTFLGTLGLGSFALSTGYPARLSFSSNSGPINLIRQGFTRRSLETPVGEIAVFEAGAGEPLLLLHGVGAGASSFLWFRLAPLLAKHYRVIAPDFVGWGESFRPERSVLFDDYVVQIRALGRWIGEPVRIVTQSLTCGFVIAAMREEGIAVERLALFSPSGGLDFGMDAFPAQATQNFARIAASPQRDEVYASIFHQRPVLRIENAQSTFEVERPEQTLETIAPFLKAQ